MRFFIGVKCIAFLLAVFSFGYKVASGQETKTIPTQNAIESTTTKDKSAVTTINVNKKSDQISTTPVTLTEVTGVTVKTTTVVTTTAKPESVIKATEKPIKLVCPGKEVARPFFALPCKRTKECVQTFGIKNMLCCANRCLKGIPAPPPEPVHSPTLFGLVERVCPAEPIPELFEVKQCIVDADCSPRICCPEKLLNGETVGYCRTAEAKLDRIPGVRQISEPIKLFMSYMQCTPPPPPRLDIFPKVCNNPLDCFPNLCCQERGKKYCRPPKRSLLALVATIGHRLVPEDAARNFFNRITT